MNRSKSCGTLFKKNLHSPSYQEFLSQINKNQLIHHYQSHIFNNKSNLYALTCYYDAIPYLKDCRERYCCVRDEDGPLTVIFDCFAEAIEPVKQVNNNKLTFDQINEANETICLLELLMFCDLWNITNIAIISRFEISALLRITLKLYPELNKGVLNNDAFCDLLCFLAIVVYSRA
eukprot:391875_1